MYLSIGGSSKSRSIARSFFRLAPLLTRLQDSIATLPVHQQDFDGIVLTLVDRPRAYTQRVRPHKRQFQLLCGFEQECPGHQQQAMLLEVIGEKSEIAIKRCPIPENDKVKLLSALNQWRDSLPSNQ
jgi:hypothetical protein